MTRPALLVAVLIYVALDLSLAGMPGAFVFDPAESVESAHGARPRVPGPFVAVAATPRQSAITLTTPPPPATMAAPLRAQRGVESVCSLARGVLPRAPSDEAH